MLKHQFLITVLYFLVIYALKVFTSVSSICVVNILDNGVLLCIFLNSYLVTSNWYLEIGLAESIYTTEIGKCYTSRLFLLCAASC